MEITYLGHSSFKLKGSEGTVVTDPFDGYVGFNMPSASADIVTVSHDHKDHNNTKPISGTARRKSPFIVDHPGEYEVGGISVFGVKTAHDDNGGVERGDNTVYSILIDGVKVCHLGDLGHELTQAQLSEIGSVDILLCPVGGVFTIDPKMAVKTIQALEPSYIIPMHYKTPKHDTNVFGELNTLEEFLKEYGAEVTPEAKLSTTKERLPEETELVVLVN
ncbi:MAG: MBL fold metallo-hydrolase [Candidatus Pacebacteria bacterium]|nr:MBL fold metallo-hydrolase [Candidatus Paceibacterota bacterium]